MEETKTIYHAMSTNNGIICYSNLIPVMCVSTYYDENEVIQKEERFGISMLDAITEDSYTRASKKENNIFIVIMLFLSIFLTIFSKNVVFGLIFMYFYSRNTFEYYQMFYLVVTEFKTKNGTKRSLAKFHAAEHKAINAYTKKQEVPTFEEVKKASRFSEKCGSMMLFNKIMEDTSYALVLIVFTECINLILEKFNIANILWLRITVSIAFAVILIGVYAILFDFVKRKGLFKFMQVFDTTNPTEKEINLAIEAIKNFEQLEKDILSGNTKSVKIICGSDGFKEFCFGDDEEEEES